MAGVDYLLPPRTPSSAFGSYKDMEDNSEITLGNDILNPTFSSHLERFYHKASPADQKRYLQLLSKFQSKQERRLRRPKTSMAAFGDSSVKHYHPLDPYLTQYTREYPGKRVETEATRPQTSQLVASYDLDGHIGNTTYDTEYFDKNRGRQSLSEPELPVVLDEIIHIHRRALPCGNLLKTVYHCRTAR